MLRRGRLTSGLRKVRLKNRGVRGEVPLEIKFSGKNLKNIGRMMMSQNIKNNRIPKPPKTKIAI